MQFSHRFSRAGTPQKHADATPSLKTADVMTDLLDDGTIDKDVLFEEGKNMHDIIQNLGMFMDLNQFIY